MIEHSKQQLVVVMGKNDERIDEYKSAIIEIQDVRIASYNDPLALLCSNDFKSADVFVSDVDLKNGYDGRNLYIEQKGRLRIVPFLFIMDTEIRDNDWDDLSVIYHKDLFDFIEYPFSKKKLKHRVNLMLTITNMYNMHTLNTIEGLRSFWRESIMRDREVINRMNAMYQREKER